MYKYLTINFIMRSDSEFEVQSDFGGKTAEELYREFLDECPMTKHAYVNYYGAYYAIMRKILPTSKDILLWMAFNCEIDRGRIIMQSLNMQRLLDELRIPRATYFKCLRDLKRHDAIRGYDAIYHINPNFVWRGTDKRRHNFIAKYPYLKNQESIEDEWKNDEF